MSTRYRPSAPGGQARPTLRPLELGSSGPQLRPKFPISPPETERNAPAHTSAVEQKGPVAPTADGEIHREETSVFRHLRRAPSVQYNQTAPFPRAQQLRTPRWLLVVLPPASCVDGEPALGHTLAMGPPGRLQSGVLVPLFPTMYGQLAAIAKEFNFPSTAGVCLYLHVSEPGVNISPRISDDAWQLLWNPYFNSDENAPSPSGLPICGQIEFDVDVRKAKWYESWLTGQEHRISLDESIPASIAQTMSRWYQEHREAAHDTADFVINDNATTTSTAHGQPRSKPIPRPLTLSTRGDGFSRSLAKYRLVNPRDAAAEPAESVASKRAPNRLSPVVQVEESANSSGHKDIDTLVRNWRATTPMAPAIPRPGPAGESVPDTYDLPLSEIDMDDYQWSVSSAGPPSRWPTSTELEAPLHSVGLDRRMLGSVILTASVATSFGPDDSLPTPTFSNASRYPSPDLAARMIEDCPATPLTATSWGAPISWPTTAASFARAPSPDMAARGFISIPNTPTTATSWGAPSVWSESPAYAYRAETPDIGRRAFGSTPPTPSTATSWGAPEVWPPSPVEEVRPLTPDIAARAHDDEIEDSPAYQFVWPFFDDNAAQAYQFVWPYLSHEANPSTAATGMQALGRGRTSLGPFRERASPSSHSEISPFSLVWPYFTGASQTARLEDLHLSAVYPSMSIYEVVYPNLVIYPPYGITDSAEVRTIQEGALVEKICPAYDYPNLVIYARVQTIVPAVNETCFTPLSNESNYGFFNLYPAVYPSIVPYPARYECAIGVKMTRPPAPTRALQEMTRLSSLYPFFDLYPATYPSLVIYPPATQKAQPSPPSKTTLNVCLPSSYPHLVLYSHVYPHLEIYPPVASRLQDVNQKGGKLPTSKVLAASVGPCSTNLPAHYPFFNLYPASYPVLEIYPQCHNTPSMQNLASSTKLGDLKLPSHYPCLCIYPAVYPHIEIYPTLPSPRSKVLASRQELKLCNTILPSFYPYLNIYPATYPFLEIYPPSPLATLDRPITPPFHHPNLVIYEPVHGSHVPQPKDLSSLGLSVGLASTYPNFDLYPAAYPHLEIYPPVIKQFYEVESVLLPGATCLYPTLCIYPALQQRHKRASSTSLSARFSESTIRSPGSPRQRTQRGSNQWALSVSPAIPRPLRGSANATPQKRPVRPVRKHRKSHSDLIREVLAQMALADRAAEESKTLTDSSTSGVSSLRRVASARVDEIPHNALHRTRTVPTPAPPMPRGARFHASSGSFGRISENVTSIGTPGDAIAAALSRTVSSGVVKRISQLDGQFTTATPPIQLTRQLSKLDRNRYPSRI